ncbi:MAG: elongation factor Ts [Breznakibacter sp.]|nr:elongation factor Ts [Breznakibacter sp.]
MAITAADISKLRNATGAGMLDCKKALTDADGDFDKAVELVRKKGLAIANKRQDREATEGAVIAKVTADGKRGALIVLNCETDFVAKNEGFVKLAESFLAAALDKNPANLDELKALVVDGMAISDKTTEQTAVIGEKIDLSFYQSISAEQVVAYIHHGAKLSTLVGFNQTLPEQVGKDVAMQVASMAPVAVSADEVPADVIAKEKEIARELARNEGKAENMLDKIADGRIQKFFKESTLLEQAFVKDNKKSIKQYLTETQSGLTVTAFVRFSLNN